MPLPGGGGRGGNADCGRQLTAGLRESGGSAGPRSPRDAVGGERVCVSVVRGGQVGLGVRFPGVWGRCPEGHRRPRRGCGTNMTANNGRERGNSQSYWEERRVNAGGDKPVVLLVEGRGKGVGWRAGLGRHHRRRHRALSSPVRTGPGARTPGCGGDSDGAAARHRRGRGGRGWGAGSWRLAGVLAETGWAWAHLAAADLGPGCIGPAAASPHIHARSGGSPWDQCCYRTCRRP